MVGGQSQKGLVMHLKHTSCWCEKRAVLQLYLEIFLYPCYALEGWIGGWSGFDGKRILRWPRMPDLE